MSPTGFLKYIYFTDLEAVDPALYAASGFGRYRDLSTGATGSANGLVTADRITTECSKYYYAGRANPTFQTTYNGALVEVYGYCQNMRFLGNDVITGPLKTNDALQIQGAAYFQVREPETGCSDTSPYPPPDPTRRWWGSGTPDPGTTIVP